jgi:aminoglycoside phosphotransferase (APT) family kinase protein
MSWWTLATPDLPQREIAACRIAEGVGVPVPKTVYAAASPLPDQTVAVLTGEPGAAGWTPGREVLAHLAQLLARLHQASAPIRDEDRAHLPDVSPDALLPRFASWADQAGHAPLRQSVDALAERFVSLQNAEEQRSAPMGLVHGDCHRGNVLSDGQRITAIIDWEEAGLGDGRLDVALVDKGVRRRDPDLADYFLRCYEEQTGYPLGPLDPWMDLTHLRNRVVSVWVKHALTHNLPLPTANPEVWIDD